MKASPDDKPLLRGVDSSAEPVEPLAGGDFGDPEVSGGFGDGAALPQQPEDLTLALRRHVKDGADVAGESCLRLRSDKGLQRIDRGRGGRWPELPRW